MREYADIRLNEYDADEWFDIARSLNPNLGMANDHFTNEMYGVTTNALFAASRIKEAARAASPAAPSVAQDERGACVHVDEPKACYRVRCQLGNKCVDDDMSPRAASTSANVAQGENHE